MSYESLLRQRDAPLPRFTAALRRVSRGLQQPAFLRMCARKSATARAFSFERRRSTRACGVRAPRRAGWSRSVPHENSLRQRDGPLPRCTAALRRASSGLQQAAFLRMCARKSPPRALSLSEGGAARALAACVCCAALIGVGPCSMEAHCASETALSLGARPRSVVPAVASNKQLSCACAHEKALPRALSLSRGGAARALAACSCRAAPVEIGSSTLEGRRANGRALSFGAWPWCHAPALASRATGLRMCARERPPGALSVGMRRRTRACRVHFLRCADLSSPSRPRSSPYKRRGLSRSVQVSASTRRPWPCARLGCLRVCADASEAPRSLSVGRRRSTRACRTRAPRRAR